jgi:hypothetical protein
MEPSCKTHFSRTFIHENFTKTFLQKEYNTHLKEIYFQKEQARFPETQELIVRKNNHKKREEELEQMSMICYIDHKHYNLLHLFYVELRLYDCYIDKNEEPSLILDEDNCYELVEHYLEFGRLPEYTAQTTHPNSKKEYGHKYHGKCPSAHCRGFITKDYNCGICNTRICPDCHVIVDTSETHNCNPATVETVKAISKETKPCPTCHAPIYKIDGCSQMWCVQCHTAFCWNTGKIETQIHNPHYYEWMRNQNKPIPQTTIPLQDDEIPNPLRLYRHFGNTTPSRLQTILTDKFTTMKYHIAFNQNITFSQEISDKQLAKFINMYYSLCQLVSHFMYDPHEHIYTRLFEEKTATLRENYLRRTIEEDAYKTRISAIYKEREYKEIFNQIIREHFVEKVKTTFENYLYDISQEIEPEGLQPIIYVYNELLKEAIQDTEREIERLSTSYGYIQQRFLVNDRNLVNIEPVRSQKKSVIFAVDQL